MASYIQDRRCNICTNTWTAIFPDTLVESLLPCPECHSRDTVVTNRWSADEYRIVAETATELVKYRVED